MENNCEFKFIDLFNVIKTLGLELLEIDSRTKPKSCFKYRTIVPLQNFGNV